METETKIYLWANGEGWKMFLLSDKKALAERNITIGDDTTIGNGAKIGYGATIGNYAKIGTYATIGDDVTIGNDAKIVKTILITGSRHTVNWWGTAEVKIGCKLLDIDYWLENFKYIGEEQNYTSEEIEEYGGYLKMIKSLINHSV